MKRIAIIGGGAAGLAAAISAGNVVRRLELASGASSQGALPPSADAVETSVKVVIFESSDRVGRSILASGNGRCNFSNSDIDASLYHNGEFVAGALAAFEDTMASMLSDLPVPVPHWASGDTLTGGASDDDALDDALDGGAPDDSAPSRGVSDDKVLNDGAPNGVVGFFESLGLIWREEGEGRLYPKANRSSVVLDVLRAAVAASGADVRTGEQGRVERIEQPCEHGGRFVLHMADGMLERADAVIVACGGSAAEGMFPDVLEFVPQHPVLGPMETDSRWVKQLDNIRVKCAIELHRPSDKSAHEKRSAESLADRDSAMGDDAVVARETGEVLFRKYGVSGIAAFNLSRLAQAGDRLSIDLFPEISQVQLQEMFVQRLSMLGASRFSSISCKDFLRGAVLPQVAHVLCEYAGVSEDAPCTKRDAVLLAQACKCFRLRYCGIGDKAQCQVRRGGFVSGSGFDETTMQAIALPGFFAAGEALDVDGPCGGYNLHWAFASGILAGAHAAASLGGRIESGASEGMAASDSVASSDRRGHIDPAHDGGIGHAGIAGSRDALSRAAEDAVCAAGDAVHTADAAGDASGCWSAGDADDVVRA